MVALPKRRYTPCYGVLPAPPPLFPKLGLIAVKHFHNSVVAATSRSLQLRLITRGG